MSMSRPRVSLPNGQGAGLKTVAVTVDADDAVWMQSSASMKPDWLQLHGGETPERAADVKARYGLPVMKAFAIRDAGSRHGSNPITALPTGSCSTPSRRKDPTFRAATG
jgi:phosphoribosylanthranilate isomerase